MERVQKQQRRKEQQLEPRIVWERMDFELVVYQKEID
jgi:hypothetical protein